MRTETAIARGAANVSTVAVDLAKRVFGNLAGKSVLVVGAGKMSRLAARHLYASGATHLVVTNRSPQKAEALAEEIDGIAQPWADLEGLLVEADVVISSTGAREPVLTKALFKKVTKARKYRAITVIDIAVPRDAEPAIGELDGVYLFDIDDLERVVHANLGERAKAAEQAHKIVEHEAGQFEQWLRTQSVVPTIRALRERFTSVADAEVQRTLDALARRAHTPEQQREAIQQLVRLVVNKLLHQPTTALRAAEQRDAEQRAAVLCELFGLEPAEGQAVEIKDVAPLDDKRPSDDSDKEIAREQARSRKPEVRGPTMIQRLVIATRGSALALWQAEHVRARLAAVAPTVDVAFEVIKTQGDKILDVPLAKVGGKGLFVKEIEQALVDRRADVAVHSMKDVPAELAPGLELSAVSTREVPWDALCAREPTTLDALPHGAKVGTSSMRRQCQLLARRPDLKIALLRGNVPTRVAKLDAGEFDAVILAAAGLTRLGLANRITQLLPLDVSIPAVAQGVLGLEVRSGESEVAELVRKALHDEDEAPRVAAERAFLAKMGGSCQTPLAAHAMTLDLGPGHTALRVVGMCGLPDGTKILRAGVTGPVTDAVALGDQLAADLLAQGAKDILAATKEAL